MRLHIQPLSRHCLAVRAALLVAFLMSASLASAIVKQQQQQQQQQQQVSQQPPSQQQRSDEASPAASSAPSSVYNHQHAGSPQQPTSSQSSGASMSGQSQAAGQQQQPQQSSYGAGSQAGSAQQASLSGAQKPSYSDSMAAAASNPEQSYQAAAQSVNMALANSGIFGGSSGAYGQAGAQQQPQASGAQQSTGGASSLNPLHYFYYPAAKESAGAQPGGQKPADMMVNAASNQYQSMASYPSYADQYSANAYVPSAGAPDVAASSQDPSYLPQPQMDQMGQQGAYSQQHQSQAQAQQPQQGYGGDLASYASQSIPQQQQPSGAQAGQQQGSSISFNGPSAGPQSPGPQDYLGQQPHGVSQTQQQQQQQQPQQAQPSYQQQGTNNLFSQLAAGGDLSTSNFGNNAGGLSSIASYMSPSSQQGQAGSHQDLFSALAGAGGGPSHHQFNQAASQLSAAIAPPQQQQGQMQPQPQPQQGSSLFSSAGSTLFGGNSQQQAGAQQQQQGLFGGALGNSYLSSFLSPQQYSQLTGQQMSAMASEQSPLSLASAIGAQQQAQQQQAAAASAQAASSLASGSSGKRFGLGSFIMPVLALAGLSLLIPTMSNIGTAVGRKKRSVVEDKASASNRAQQIVHDSMNGAQQLLKESSLGEYLEKIERYYAIYKNAVESDDCLNRLICEFGEVARDYTGKGVAMMSVVEKMVPQWMEHKMHLFREAAMNHKEGKEKCKKYVCHSGSRQH